MITLRIKYADSTVNITFPCTENTLAAKLMELHASDHEGDPFFVEEVIEPRDIAPFFEMQFLDLNEVNYLAKRMENFMEKELNRFFAASTLEGHSIAKIKPVVKQKVPMNREWFIGVRITRVRLDTRTTQAR